MAAASTPARRRTCSFSVVAKQEVHAVKQIIHDEDPNAFVVLTVANETMGEGFSRLLPK
mgnify:CR=1 FL=1